MNQSRRKPQTEAFIYVLMLRHCISFLFYRVYRILFKTKYVVVHKEKELLYINIPKSACSTIKTSLLPLRTLEKVEFAEKNKTLNVDKIIQDSQNEQSYELKAYYCNPHNLYQEYFTFSFVRNPFTRLVSFYKDKVENKWNFLHYFFGVLDYSKNFEEFVKKICIIPDFLLEDHFRSQYSFLFNRHKQCLVRYIGHVETIVKDYEILQEKFNLNKLHHINKTKKSKHWMDYYNKHTATMVYKKYYKDFQTFGYTNSYFDLLNYIEQNSSTTC